MSFHSVVIQKLLNANAHISRRVTNHHFKIFSEGSRNNVSIIDADKTLICLRSACNFIGHLARNNARFLFVNTNDHFDEIINQMTQTAGIKNDPTWRLGGFLTNSSSPKKFRGRNKKFNIGAIEPPDCIVIFDTERKSSVIQEAYRRQIPVVGLVDSSMPWDTFKKITYPIPANDSVEFVYLFCNLITKTILKDKEAIDEDVDELLTRGDDDNKEKPVIPYESLQNIPEDAPVTKELLDKLVVLKFNGKLGDKIGFDGPKSTMEITDGLTSLDLIINQIEAVNGKYGCNIPLLLVNPSNQREAILKVLEKHPNKNIHSVTQNVQRDLEVEDDDDVEVEDDDDVPAEEHDNQDEMDFDLASVLLLLLDSGKLDVLLSQGKEYILILSSDNVAHVFDPKILNHLVQSNIRCCLEVMPKPSEFKESKIPIDTKDAPILAPKKNWKFTDRVWMKINFINRQYDWSISKLFDQHSVLSVPKTRYLPFESTSDLFLLQSDLYILKDGVLTRNTARQNPADPRIELGAEFKNMDDFQKRFKSIPSIVELKSLTVKGDVWFGSGITLKGEVNINGVSYKKTVIPDGTVLDNKDYF